jgi:hypothetical protein
VELPTQPGNAIEESGENPNKTKQRDKKNEEIESNNKSRKSSAN